MNCLLWCFYGLPIVHPHSLLVITINGTGLVFETIYLSIFLIYSDAKQRVKIALIILVELAFISAVAAVVLSIAHTHEKRSMMVGVLCVIFGTMMYASPLSVMGFGAPPVPTQQVIYLLWGNRWCPHTTHTHTPTHTPCCVCVPTQQVNYLLCGNRWRPKSSVMVSIRPPLFHSQITI